MNNTLNEQLLSAVQSPPAADVARSRLGVRKWFDAAAPLIAWDSIDTPIGTLLIAVSGTGLCDITFTPDEASLLARLDPLARVLHDPTRVAAFKRELTEYFAGKRQTFDLPIDWGGIKPFQRTVLQAALTIPLGTYWTYQQVAQAIGRPKASRAVGQALARNPIPIVLPCHRVLGSDGSLHGYAGGLERKRILLTLEGALR
jgi:O-6-methylguanine DNA methyltransferase